MNELFPKVDGAGNGGRATETLAAGSEIRCIETGLPDLDCWSGCGLKRRQGVKGKTLFQELQNRD